MVEGPSAGLKALVAVEQEPGLVGNHRLDAIRAHLLEVSSDLAAARLAYLRAARMTLSIPEQRYLEERARRLAATSSSPPPR
jgi:predicted RNA polymerase sigma factor